VVVVLNSDVGHHALVKRCRVLRLSVVDLDDYFQRIVLAPELEYFLGYLVDRGLAFGLKLLAAINIL
jgi:hypothetical protein